MIRIHILRRPAPVAPAAPAEPPLQPLEYAEQLAGVRRNNLEHVELRMQAAKNLGYDLEPFEKVIERYSIELEEALRLLDLGREIQRIQAEREATNV